MRLNIFGNHSDPQGNPMGYYRMTQRSKWKDPRAKRYIAWKNYVQQCWLEFTGDWPRFDPAKTYRLNVKCYLKTGPHADPENIRKGIQDALFWNGDKNVVGTVEREYVSRDPRLEITVGEECRGSALAEV